tara:strand:+ start:914 stop:1768 length:855 start_codon:yes stop_codon:yes gene_type:complete
MAIILPGGFQITNNEAVDSRLSVADQAARLGFSAANVYEGLLVYQQDTDEIYVLTDATDPTDNNNWNKIYPVASMTGSFSGSFTGSFDGLINSASFAETASYAEYAVSASHEIVHETSSSFAETASFAESGRGEFGGTFSGSNFSTEFTFDGDVLNVMGDVFVQGTLDAATKNFKIQHPTMPAYYLVHSSLEGPERGIYHRGKLKTSDTIYLPDYWLELTDDTDITVQLTPIGNSCQHFIKSVNREEIEVGCDCGKPHCFYIVHAQRYNEGPFNVLEPKKSVKL